MWGRACPGGAEGWTSLARYHDLGGGGETRGRSGGGGDMGRHPSRTLPKQSGRERDKIRVSFKGNPGRERIVLTRRLPCGGSGGEAPQGLGGLEREDPGIEEGIWGKIK